MPKFKEIDLTGGIVSADFAVLGGLIDQGAIDRARLRRFLQNLLDDLAAAGKADAYAFILAKTVEFLDKTDRPTARVTLQSQHQTLELRY